MGNRSYRGNREVKKPKQNKDKPAPPKNRYDYGPAKPTAPPKPATS